MAKIHYKLVFKLIRYLGYEMHVAFAFIVIVWKAAIATRYFSEIKIRS